MKRTSAAKMTFFWGIPLHLRNDLHLGRKAFHLFFGLLIVFIYMSGISRNNALLTLSFFLGLVLVLETIRLKNRSFNEKFVRYWAPIMRCHEVSNISTVPHYISSVLLAVAIFPKPIAVLSILYLACGDPVASLMGILYGHLGPRVSGGKTLIGTLAGCFVCSAVTFFYTNSLSFSNQTVLILSLLGGLAGGLAELLPFNIDDNFTIPVISGFVLWLAFLTMGL